MNLDFDNRDRDSVLRDLASTDEEVRRLAVERSVVLPTGVAIPHLVERIGDASWRVRKAAVERLAGFSDVGPVVDALAVALSDGENTGRRNSAVEALVEIGARAVSQLVATLQNPDADVRKLVVDALAGIGDERSTPALIEILGDSDANVRAAAADALGILGGEAAMQALERIATRDEEEQLVRFSALHAMAALEAPVRAVDIASVLGDRVLRPAGLALLGRVEDEAAEAELLKALGSSARSVREAAIGSLLRTLSRLDGRRAERLSAKIREEVAASPWVVRSAIERLSDANLATRLMLVQFLGITADAASVVPMLMAAQDEALSQITFANLEALGETAERAIDSAWSELDSKARRDACSLFGRFGGGASAARLVAALDDPTPEIRNAAARSVGERGMVDAVPLLVRRLENTAQDDDFEREEETTLLTEALVALASPSAKSGANDVTNHTIELLTSSLEGAGETVRLSIATVIGRIGRREDAEVVELLLKDPSPAVRRAAVEALARLEPGTAAESLRLALADEAPTVRIAAAAALGASLNRDVIEVLRCLAEDEEPDVRAAAIGAVSRWSTACPDGAPQSMVLGLIDSALEDEAVVALAAIEALRAMGAAGTDRVLRVIDRPEPELIQEAARCIGESGDAVALEALLPLVSHRDWSVRAEAIHVLAERRVSKAVPAILRRLETEHDDFVRDTILRALDRLEG